MWAPLAALVFAIGIVNTPSMIEAERAYLEDQEPVMDVQGIEAADANAGERPEAAGQMN